jgi:hypothetical protein
MTETAAPQSPADVQAAAPALSWSGNAYGKPSIRMEWVLAVNPDGSRELAVINVHHYTSAKRYIATLHRSTQRFGDGVTSELYSPMDSVRVDEQPVGRYNRKAHIAFAQQVEERLAAGEYNPAALPKFDVNTPV